MTLDKSKFLDDQGRPLTQGLFLEINYDDKYAVYTLKENDHTWNGKVYPSLKRIYLEEEDPNEYIFVSKNLYSWEQWKRLNNNKMIRAYIEEWREELALKLSSRAIKDMINLTASENGSFQAAKYIAERGWEKRGAGRPSKQEIERRIAVDTKLDNEFSKDIARLEDYRKG